jgi:hypothetical protein
MSKKYEQRPGTPAYYEQFSGLPPDHPEYGAATLGTLGGIAAGIGLAVWIAMGAATAEPSPRPADGPGYEMPAGGAVNPAPGAVNPLPEHGRAPGPADIPLRELPALPYPN